MAKAKKSTANEVVDENVLDPKTMPDIEYNPNDPQDILNEDALKENCVIGFCYITVKLWALMVKAEQAQFGGGWLHAVQQRLNDLKKYLSFRDNDSTHHRLTCEQYPARGTRRPTLPYERGSTHWNYA